MTRLLLLALGAVLAVLSLPGAVDAQQQRCQQVLQSDLRRIVDASGHEIIYYRDPVRMICSGGIQIEADSAVMNSTAQTVELVGGVLYRDGERQLTSDWANYLSPTDELFARGAVVLTDLADGSVITGDDFEYRRATDLRPESRMIIRGERPHAVIRPARAPDAVEAAPPVEVWARRMEMLGESVFLAQTDVEFQREDMRGAADALRFDQTSERMTLTGRAHVESDEYRLDGDRIDARMQNNVLQTVLAERQGRLVADELTVRGRNIRIGFADGQPERVEAWDPATRSDQADEADEETTPRPRAMAISQDFRLRADSIDARSDGGRLRQVTAVGRAYGEGEPDPLSVDLPDAIARDWIQGDTIIGFFAEATEAGEEPDEGASPEALPTEDGRVLGSDGAVLERIEVIGGDSHALSLYRTLSGDAGARPSVNFMRARRITLYMLGGEVSRVEADGPIEGIYLDPDGNERPATPMAS